MMPSSPVQLTLESMRQAEAVVGNIREPIRLEDGYIILPTKPGLGVELDEEKLAQHPYTGRELTTGPQEDSSRGNK